MKYFIILLIFTFSCVQFGFAQLKNTSANGDRIYINVGRAQVKKSLIALPGIKLKKTTKFSRKARDIFEHTVKKDLKFSNFFKFLPASSFLEKPQSVSYLPRDLDPRKGFAFQKWRDAKAEFLIQGIVKKAKTKELKLHLYLYYVPQQKLVFEKDYSGKAKLVRSLAHDFANDVMKKLTGKESIFKTKLLFSSDRAGRGQKEIYMMNWDGSNIEALTNHNSIALSPSWSPGGNQISYTAFTIDPRQGHRNPNLYIFDRKRKKRVLISSRKGINSGSAFVKNGRSLLTTLSATGNPDIYKIALNGKVQKKITSGPFGAMNVEPAIAPDGKTIAFSSDRSGRPMIYTMGISPITPAKRITKAGRYNAAPAFSPDGDKIVFAGYDKDHFDIFIMNSNGTNLTRLTQKKKPNGRWSSNESPSFSPDGRFIAFTSNRSGKKQIYITNLQGNITVPVTKDNHNYFQPQWSPYLD